MDIDEQLLRYALASMSPSYTIATLAHDLTGATPPGETRGDVAFVVFTTLELQITKQLAINLQGMLNPGGKLLLYLPDVLADIYAASVSGLGVAALEPIGRRPVGGELVAFSVGERASGVRRAVLEVLGERGIVELDPEGRVGTGCGGHLPLAVRRQEGAGLGLDGSELLGARKTPVVLGCDRRIGVGHQGQLAVGPPGRDEVLADDVAGHRHMGFGCLAPMIARGPPDPQGRPDQKQADASPTGPLSAIGARS